MPLTSAFPLATGLDLAMKEMWLPPEARVLHGRFYERIADSSVAGPQEIKK